MSLHALANNMAAQGRGPDSTLVHMSPREVHGLQALAMANGGTLTINPHTGLPEAGFLDSLLPALAGFALNAFVPGLGEAVGGMFGLGGAAGTGIAVGGATALASGDLSKGLMAGLGAYGGAGLGGNLLSAGDATMAGPPVSAMGLQEGAAAQAAAPVSTLERMQAGLGSMGNAPMDALKNNAGYLASAAAPALSGAFGEQPTSNMPKIHPGYIRKYDRDPITGSLYQVSATPADQYTGGITFGGVPETKRYDTGGVTFGGVGTAVDAQGNPFTADQKDMRSDSERAQDYLSGKGPNPFLFYHKAPTVDPIQKAAEATKEIAKIVEEQQQHGGNPADRAAAMGSSVSNYAPDVNSYSNGLVHALLNPVANDAPVVDIGTASGFKSVAEAESAQNKALAEQYGQYRTLQQAQNETALAHDIAAVNAANAEGPPAANPMGKDPAQSQGQGTGTGEGVGRTPGEAHDGQGGTGGGLGEGSGAGRYGAQGGYLNNGQFDRSYAYGGGITALAGGGRSFFSQRTSKYQEHTPQIYADGGATSPYNLGSYSDGGRLLRGPGDGVSDSIPATIGEKQPARLADGEFVVPARIVSELGNGSTEAGARKLYDMMDRVQKARSKTVGKDRVATNTRADNYLPA